MPRTLRHACFAAIATLLFQSPASAEQSTTIGDYVVHYNAFSTEILQPEVAKAFGIVRSKARGLLNVSILKKVMGTLGQPSTGTVSVTATNLNEQLQTIDMREVTDHGAIYYLGSFPVSNNLTLQFKMTVSPEGSNRTETISFKQEFFIN